MSRVVSALAAPSDWTTIAHELDVARQTAVAYVEALAASFALIVLAQRDLKRQQGSALRRPRKLYLGDLALAAIPAATAGPTASDSQLVENVIAVALLRAAEPDALERFSHPDHLFYWRSKDGREIDFLVTEPTLPIESKYGARPTGKDYESITKAFGRGIMVSRRDLDLERPVLTIPAGVLLALIGDGTRA
jgi:hypothetical protein